MASIADIDEYSAAEEMAKKKLAAMKGLSRETKRRRLHDTLLRRGFSAAVTFKVLERIAGAGNDEGL